MHSFKCLFLYFPVRGLTVLVVMTTFRVTDFHSSSVSLRDGGLTQEHEENFIFISMFLPFICLQDRPNTCPTSPLGFPLFHRRLRCPFLCVTQVGIFTETLGLPQSPERAVVTDGAPCVTRWDFLPPSTPPFQDVPG